MDSTKARKLIKDDDNDDHKLGIHEDFVVEILSKLRVKDVLQCRLVSKHWLALTTTSYFIDKHLLRHHDDDLDLPRMIFFSSLQNDSRQSAFSVVSVKKTAIFPLSFLKQQPFYKTCKIIRLVGSSNGLVCFFLMHNIIDDFTNENNNEEKYELSVVVWNPVTTRIRILPKPNAVSNIPFKNQDEKNDIVNVVRGHAILCSPYIGLDSVHHYNDDGIMIATGYKLARVFAHDDCNKTIFRAQVFVQDTNSWEPVKNELELSSLEQSFPTTCISLNGFMYWKVTLKGGKCGLISFDMHRQVFTVVKLPLTLRIQRHWGVSRLLVWQDSLAVTAFEYLSENIFGDYILVLWTMSNTKDSIWTPQFRLDSSILPKGYIKTPLGGLEDRFLISISRDDDDDDDDDEQVIDGYPRPAFLCSYDPKTEKVEENILRGGTKTQLHRSGVNYVPTLAPV